MTRSLNRLLLVMFALALVLAASGCGKKTEKVVDSPASAVDRLLTMRSEGVTDAALYSKVLSNAQVAGALAQDSATRDSKTKPTPPWEEPKVVKKGNMTADVKVIWKKSADHPGWAKSTTFRVSREDGTWKVVDVVAEDNGSAETSAAPAAGSPGSGSK